MFYIVEQYHLLELKWMLVQDVLTKLLYSFLDQVSIMVTVLKFVVHVMVTCQFVLKQFLLKITVLDYVTNTLMHKPSPT